MFCQQKYNEFVLINNNFVIIYIHLFRNRIKMNKTVQIVNEWAAYEAQYPDADLEDFCRHYLTLRRSEREAAPFDGRAMPPTPRSILLKLLGRIVSVMAVYSKKAMRGVSISHPDAFPLLNSAWQLGEASKTDIIQENIIEFSTGIDMLNRLHRDGLISERADPNDRRSKLVRITPEGKDVLFEIFGRFHSIGDLMLHDLPEEDIQLCIQLLKGVENKHWKICAETKGLAFEEIFAAYGPSEG